MELMSDNVKSLFFGNLRKINIKNKSILGYLSQHSVI